MCIFFKNSSIDFKINKSVKLFLKWEVNTANEQIQLINKKENECNTVR